MAPPRRPRNSLSAAVQDAVLRVGNRLVEGVLGHADRTRTQVELSDVHRIQCRRKGFHAGVQNVLGSHRIVLQPGSRPATILWPAPAASQRPVPTAPLTHPIGGGHLHEASSGVHSRSPITPRWLAATPEPESKTASRRSSPRPRPPDGTTAASASTPGFAPRGHPQSTPGRRQALRALARVLHLRHQPNLQTVPPTSLMHPHVAHSPRWTRRSPSRSRRRPGDRPTRSPHPWSPRRPTPC